MPLFLNSPKVKKAVAYYRHSAEDKQENSVQIQKEHTHKFAIEHQIEIIHEEADRGETGLLADRPAFTKLFDEWILNPKIYFDYILVYDVSRWGRFQDQDEAAYYEFCCKQKGKKVIYVSKGFPNEDNELISHLQTSMERYMAAEFSRQLSNKVFYGCVKVSEQGYSAGGTACYGMNRILLDENKNPIKILKRGEHKLISNQRVTFNPCYDQTTETVKTIFNLLVEKWQTPDDIARLLNRQKVPSANGGQWNKNKIVRVLTNEIYIGTRIYNKTWGRLKKRKKWNPKKEWVICHNAFPATIAPSTFKKAQEHLYWICHSQCKKGIYKTNKSRGIICRETKNLLKEDGWTDDNIAFILKNIPLIFSIIFYHQSIPHWCFSIKEKNRQHNKILAIGISLDQNEQPIQNFFAIPIEDFNISNFLIFSKKDSCYQKYKVERNELEKVVLSFCKKLKQ